jgi:hypothetical protein
VGCAQDYPVPSLSDPQELQSVLSAIRDDGVEIVFPQPGIDDPAFNDGLTQLGIRAIGYGAPGPEIPSSWIAAIEPDAGAAVTSAWPKVVSGESAGSLKMPMRVVAYDPARLTPGRVQLLQTTIDDLENGFIDTGVDPLTGEAR